ncbi:hypothetical protein H4S08_003983 [Coemansia sp. RSA 1365]|nr:hypothetical protein H4S08_003983 [Coemansia sp. RSA 1365]
MSNSKTKGKKAVGGLRVSLFHLPATLLENIQFSTELNQIDGIKLENTSAIKGRGHYSTPHIDEKQLSEVSQAFETVRLASPICNTCGGIEFEDTLTQRVHFKTKLHQENISRKIEWRQNNVDVHIAENEYPWNPKKPEITDDGIVENGAASELSESDDSLLDAEHCETVPVPVVRRSQGYLDIGSGEHLRYLWFTSENSGSDQRADVVAYGIQRRVLIPKGTHGVHVDAGLVIEELRQMQLLPAVKKTQEELKEQKRAEIERQQEISAGASTSSGLSGIAANLPETDPQSSYWTIISSDGGFFAAAIFENRSGEIIIHKTIQRYTTRRKQGGLQSRQDNAAGHAANSAGAQIRRHNERRLQEEVYQLLEMWRPLIKICTHVFVRVPRASRKTFFAPADSKNCVLEWADSRIRAVPVPMGRPTLTELQRVYREITTVRVEQFDLSHPEEITEEQTEMSMEVKQDELDGSSSDYTLEPEPRPDLAAFLGKVAQMMTDETLSDVKIVEFLCENLATLLDAFGDPAVELRYLGAAEGVKAQRTPTLLHLASSLGRKDLVGFLLDNGEDPTITNGHPPQYSGMTAYEVSKDRPTRDAFRIYRFEHEGEIDGIDWQRARVPEPLTREQQQENEAREEERRKKQRQKRTQRVKKQKERKQRAQQTIQDEDDVLLDKAINENKVQERYSLKRNVGGMSDKELRARMLSMATGAWSSNVKETRPVSPTKQKAAERELRFQAAERRRLGQTYSTENCTHCGKPLHGIVPFEQFDWKCCSTTCLHLHQEEFGI